jgi:hypothetical protein
MSFITSLRNQLYTAIDTRKTASGFTYGNDFTLEKTWRPYQELKLMGSDHPTGKVYIIGGNPIGFSNLSRTNTVLGNYSTMVGFQRLISDITSLSEVDAYTDFLQELEEICISGLLENSSFSFDRLEYLRDPDGLPFAFIGMRDEHTFEAYFSVYYNLTRRAVA